MKRWTRYVLAAVAAFLALAAVQPEAAVAAHLDINGTLINTDDDQPNDVLLEDGVTLVSDDFLHNHLYLDTARDGDVFTLTNAFGDFTITGEVGSRKLVLDDAEMTLPIAPCERDGLLYVPLRALMENFGEVGWDGTTTVRFDYNAQAKIEAVTMAESSPLSYRIVPNSGYSFDEPAKNYYPTTPDGYYVIDTDEEGLPVSVSRGEKKVLWPQHEGFMFARSGVSDGFEIDADYAAWVEIPSFSARADNSWYLYVKDMTQANAEPVLVDKGVYSDASGVQTLMGDWSFNNGTLLYTKPLDVGSDVEIYLYRVGDSAPTLLDTFRHDARYRGYVDVALGDNYAVWNERLELERLRVYGKNVLYDLESGKTRDITQGYNVEKPLIVGDQLLVQTREDGSGMIEEDNHQLTDIPNAVWVYDMEKGAWTYRADTTLEPLSGCTKMDTPIVMDEQRVVLTATGAQAAYALPVLDLKEGKVWTLANENAELLRHCPRDCSEASVIEAGRVVGDVYPEHAPGAGNYLMAFVQASEEEGFSRIICTVVVDEWTA
ncbi:MAG: copper amine oxidase N-terminal domain-containing protein [Peptococcaceae bacterium]|nr:copper amine oxidase N-terminal domain-containing protein [Peptococcaceae bacterium]